MKAPLIADEEARLNALREIGVLDTPAEAAYDLAVGLAARTFDAPIALVSLVEEDRQWFKANLGLNVCETSRDVSFCAHALLSDEPFLVEDASLDPRFEANELVTGDLHIRFYAGAPIITAKGYPLGSLCVIDSKPGKATPEQLDTLKRLAQYVACLLERTRVENELARLNGALEDAWKAVLDKPIGPPSEAPWFKL